jgi:hypothetical protein
LVVATFPAHGAAQSSRQQLILASGLPVPSTYASVRDAKDWLNPQVCPGGIDVTVRSVERKSMVAIRELSGALIKLPVEAWPYGRVEPSRNARSMSRELWRRVCSGSPMWKGAQDTWCFHHPLTS